MKVGRNEPCPCGSGEKYKRCCEGKAAKQADRRSRLVLWVMGALALIGIVGIASSIVANRAPEGRVWSAEHGHFHDR